MSEQILTDENSKLDVLVQLVCDSNNQPHQYVGKPDMLKSDILQSCVEELHKLGRMP